MQALCWQTDGMRTATVRGIPDELYAWIQREAAANRRSVNAQMLVMLEEAFRPPVRAAQVPPEVLDEIRRRYPKGAE